MARLKKTGGIVANTLFYKKGAVFFGINRIFQPWNGERNERFLFVF